MRTRVTMSIAIMLGLFANGCASSGESWEIVARFPRAVALYEQSDVLVMGVKVGEVSDLAVDGDEIVVTMSIDRDVPLPADVTAAIAPSSLIGERNVVLGPAWRPGTPELEANAVIPRDRTIVPVEPDEALEAVTDLVLALDAESLNEFVSASADAADGTGRQVNQALKELAELLPFLAEQDDELIAIAEDVRVLADVIRTRDEEIARLLSDFEEVASVLGDEREAIVSFVESLVSLSRRGEILLESYEVSLPEDLETVAAVALQIKASGPAVQELVTGLHRINETLLLSVDPDTNSIRTRVLTEDLVTNQLVAILDVLGAPSPDCIPLLGNQCA